MCLVTPSMGIKSISGKMGNVCFRTMKATGKIYMNALPSGRKTPIRPQEVRNREKFGARARLVAQMLREGSELPAKQLWKLAKVAL